MPGHPFSRWEAEAQGDPAGQGFGSPRDTAAGLGVQPTFVQLETPPPTTTP